MPKQPDLIEARLAISIVLGSLISPTLVTTSQATSARQAAKRALKALQTDRYVRQARAVIDMQPSPGESSTGMLEICECRSAGHATRIVMALNAQEERHNAS